MQFWCPNFGGVSCDAAFRQYSPTHVLVATRRCGRSNGETMVVNVRIWNETVSNLTLMALGSSAPEILLSVIEVVGNNFEAGDLGPGTIVGSAAFNLFVIIGLCVSVIPEGEVRLRAILLTIIVIVVFLPAALCWWA